MSNPYQKAPGEYGVLVLSPEEIERSKDDLGAFVRLVEIEREWRDAEVLKLIAKGAGFE